MKCRSLSVYFQVVKTQLIRNLTYKFEVYSNIIMQGIIILAGAFFWKALFKNCDSYQGVTAETMLTYTVVSSIISVVLSSNVERRITNSVMKGNIAVDMMRPVNLFSIFLAEDVAHLIALFFQNIIPIFIIGSLIAKIPTPASKEAFGFFMLSLFFAFWINWLFAVIFGMIAFYVVNMDALIQVKKHLIRLLSGSIIPIWFFPDWLKNILNCLPFAYMYQLPLDIFIGKKTGTEMFFGLMLQLIWLLGLFVVFLLIQNKVTKKVMIQGG